MSQELVSAPTGSLVEDLRARIIGAQGRAAKAVNSDLVGLYWQIGPVCAGSQRAAGRLWQAGQA